MKILTSNIEFGMTPSQIKAAGARLARSRAGVIGLQEIRGNMGAHLQAGLGAAYGWVSGGETPEAYRKGRWEVVSRQSVKATPGLDGVTPDLYITRVVYRARRNHKLTFAVYNTHLVPLTLHGRWRTDHLAWRKARWADHWGKLRQLVLADVRAGMTCFVMGDFNNIFASEQKIKEIHPRAKWLYRSGLDWLFVVEGSVKVTRAKRSRVSFATGSDHKAGGAIVLLNGRP